MAGFSTDSFELLEGDPHIEQSLSKIVESVVAERPLREWIGNPGLQLLGNNMTQENILRFFMIIWALTELYEPRYRVQNYAVNELTRGGISDFTMNGQHKPYAHLDWEQSQAFVSIPDSSVIIKRV